MVTMPRQPHPSRSQRPRADKALEYSSVQKAICILLSFLPGNKPAGNLELSNALALNKSTVSRLTRVLAHYGLLQQDNKTQKYELGRMSALLGMAVEISQSERLALFGQPYVEELRNRVRESVCLEVLLATGEVKLVASAVGPHPLTITFPETLLLQVTGGAKAILAFSDPEFRDSMINAGMSRMADRAKTNAKTFKARLDEVRKQGFAYDRGESNAGVNTVSVPVFNHLMKPVAALSICVPVNRLHRIDDPANLKLLQQTARMISTRLFYEEPKNDSRV